MSLPLVLLLLACSLNVVAAGILTHLSRSLPKPQANENFNNMFRLLAEAAGSSGTSSASIGSHAMTYTSPTSSSASLSVQRKALNSRTDKARSRSLNKSVPTGVIYFGKNSAGCPACNILSRWVAMHSKRSLDMSPFRKRGEVYFQLTSTDADALCSQLTTPPT